MTGQMGHVSTTLKKMSE